MHEIEVKMTLFEFMQMVLHLETWRENGHTLKKNLVMLGFLW
jgi:hypothetical protein